MPLTPSAKMLAAILKNKRTMGSIIWDLKSCVNTILDIIVIKTGIVISEDYLIEILNQEFPNSYFENYSIKKNNAVRIRSEKFDEICWSVRKRLGELEINSPLFIQNIDKIIAWEEQGICYFSLFRKILKMMSDIYNPNNPQFIDPKPIIDQLVFENKYPIEVIIEVFKEILHNQTMSNTIKPVEEILWDGGIPLSNLFEKEHIHLSSLRSPITFVIGLFLCAGAPYPFKNTHKELFRL